MAIISDIYILDEAIFRNNFNLEKINAKNSLKINPRPFGYYLNKPNSRSPSPKKIIEMAENS